MKNNVRNPLGQVALPQVPTRSLFARGPVNDTCPEIRWTSYHDMLASSISFVLLMKPLRTASGLCAENGIQVEVLFKKREIRCPQHHI